MLASIQSTLSRTLTATTTDLETVTEYDYEAVDRALAGLDEDPEDMASMSDLSSALLKVLYWACGASGNTAQTRMAAVGAWIEALLRFKDDVGLRLSAGKREYAWVNRISFERD
jgi:hypothetical protein